MGKSTFDVKINSDRYGTYISITNNGWQWANIEVKEPEKNIPVIINELRKYLEERKNKS